MLWIAIGIGFVLACLAIYFAQAASVEGRRAAEAEQALGRARETAQSSYARGYNDGQVETYARVEREKEIEQGKARAADRWTSYELN
jgi:hypothetical protein